MNKVTKAFMMAALLFGGGSLIVQQDAHAQAGATVGQLRGQIKDKGDNNAAAVGATVTSFFVTRERRATFRQTPGSGRLRPPARTELPGCVLAGAWTATGWPDTMEGAVRSGNEAARVVGAYLAHDARGRNGHGAANSRVAGQTDGPTAGEIHGQPHTLEATS